MRSRIYTRNKAWEYSSAGSRDGESTQRVTGPYGKPIGVKIPDASGKPSLRIPGMGVPFGDMVCKGKTPGTNTGFSTPEEVEKKVVP